MPLSFNSIFIPYFLEWFVKDNHISLSVTHHSGNHGQSKSKRRYTFEPLPNGRGKNL